MFKLRLTKTIFYSLVLICCITSFSSIVLAYSVGPSTATTETNVSGWTDWTTTRLSSKDDQYATTNVTAATATLSGFDFSGIPAGANIEGIVVHIQASESQAQAYGYLMTYLSWDNGTSYTSGYRTPDSEALPTSDTDYDEGGESDDWGHSWTVSEVTSTFKVKIWGYCAASNRQTRIDYVAVTVHYSVVDVSNYTGGTPTVPPISVDKPSTGNCLGTFKFDGGGTISQITITEYGTCDAENDLENIKLFKDANGEGDWDELEDTTQLGSTTTFNASNKATFSSLNLTAGSTCYVHVVLDVNSNPTDGETIGIELYQNDIVCTSTTTASSWPVQLGTSTIGTVVIVSEYSVGTSSAPWTYVSQGSENNLLGTFKFDGSGTVTAITIHQYGSCDADADLENVKLYQDDGDGNWEPVADTTQLGSTTSFDASDEATFSDLSLSASTFTYVHVVADVKTSATLTETVGVDITAANKVTLISGIVTASSWPVQLGTTEISGYFIYVADTGNNRIVKRLASDLSYVVKIGTYGAGNDQFDAPYGIAADKDYIYVADSNNNRIVRRNKTDLSYVDQVTSANGANLNGPRGIASDGTYVYIGDYANHRVLKLNRSDLSFVAQAGVTGVSGTDNDHFNSPSGITFDETYLYIADSVNHRIMKRKISDLSYVDKIGSQGTGDDQFNKCYGMAVYSGYVFVGDEHNHRVVKRRTSNLSYVAQQGASPPGTSGTGDGEFNQTKYVATDDTYVYACDGVNNRIQKLNQSNLSFVSKIGGLTAGSGNDQFDYPRGVAHDTLPEHTIVSNYTGGTPTVPPATVDKGSTGNCLGTFHFSGSGTVSQITLTQYGTCEAPNDLENVKLFKDDGDGDWESGEDTTQLGSTTTFSGASSTATFSGFNLTVGATAYVHVVLDVKDTATYDETIGIEILQSSDVTSTKEVAAISWAVKLGTSTISLPQITVSNYIGGTPTVPPNSVAKATTGNCLGTFHFDGTGTISQITLTEYGTCDADTHLENVKLFQDANGEGDWNESEDTTQIGSTTTFNASNKATFSSLSLEAGSTTYVHVVLDIKSNANDGDTVGIELRQDDIVCTTTTTASGWPVQLGTSTISAGWTAYNDCADDVEDGASGYDSTGNVTNIGGQNSPPSGELRKYSDYTVTGVTLTLSGTGMLEGAGVEDDGGTGRSGSELYPPSGDAEKEFGTIINMGKITYTSDPNDLTVTLEGVSSSKKYTLVVLGMRGRYADRRSSYTISGVSSYVNSSSTGIPAGDRTGPTTTYNAGDNYTDGYVAKWTNIVPESTSITITITSPDNNKRYISAIKLVEESIEQTTVSNYTSGTPTVPPATVYQGATGDCLGTFKFDGVGTISQITLTEYGTCDALNELENVKLFQDDGDGNWESSQDTTQLGSTTTFSGSSSTATFSGFNLTAGTTCYVHVVLDVLSDATTGQTVGIELYQDDIICTSTTTASSWPVQLGTSTINIPHVTVSNYTEGSPSVPPGTVYKESTENCLGTFRFDGVGTISQITLTEYGNCDAPNELENVKLFQDDGDGNWESGDDTTQLGSTTTFSGSSSTATFSGLNLTAGSTCYVHIVLDVLSSATTGQTVGIELYQDDIICTSTTTASSWPVQLGTSTINIPHVTVSNYTEGSPSVPPSKVYQDTTKNCLGTFKFDGVGTISQITLTEYGTCDADSHLENVKLFRDEDGEGDWNESEDTTQLGSTTTFNASNKATFSSLNLTAGSTTYVHVVLDVKSTTNDGDTIGIELYQDDIVCTSTTTASSWPVQLGTSTITVPAGWTAYNDLAGVSEGNVTNYTREPDTGRPDNGPLINYETGETLNVNLTVSGSSDVSFHDESLSGPGTDAYDIFNGKPKINVTGVFSYTQGDHIFTFTGLNPNRKYRFVHFGNRTGGDTYLDRMSKVVISEVDSFETDSSAGVTLSTTTMAGDSATYCTGENTATGYVAAWTNIDPGAIGNMVITVTLGTHQYSNAIMLQELAAVNTEVSAYTSGTPTVPSETVYQGATGDCLGTFKFDGVGTISQITLTEYGNCNALNELENVKLFQDDGDGNWESGDDTTQLGSTTTFSGSSSTATFSGLNLTAGSACYVHVVLDVLSGATTGQTVGIELYQDDIICTSTTTASSWPVQLGTSTIITPQVTVSKYTEGSPSVPPSKVYQDTTKNCLGTFKFDGVGTISQITLTEYGTCDALNELENVKLFQDDGDGNWESGDDTTQLGSTTTFSGSSSTATFSGLNLTAGSACYVHIVLDVLSTATTGQTVGIELYQDNIICTSTTTASGWPVQLGTSTINILQVTVSNYTGGSPSVPPATVYKESTENCLGTFRFDGLGTISQITITEYGNCDATTDLENVKLFQDDGDGDWESSQDTTQLGSTTTFDVNKATFSSLSLTASATCYVHVVLDVNSNPTDDETVGIELYQDDIVCTTTTTASGWPVQLGTSNIATYTEEATIAFIGDGRPRLYGDGESQLTNDLNQIDDQMGSGWTLDAVQTPGDMDYISEAGQQTFDDAYSVSDVSTTPVFYGVGNHEIDNSYDMPVLRNKFSGYSFNPSSGPTNCEETTYSYDVGDIHVVVLNEYFDGTSDTGTDGDVVNALFDWLKDDLRNTNKPYKVIVGHEPAYPIVRHVGDSLDGYPDNRNRFWNLLKTERVMAYFTGHDHNYQFTEHDGVFECDTGVTGGMVGGADMDDFATIFYAHCDVNGFQIRSVNEDPSWASPTVVTKTRSDLQTQVMVNTAERAGTECSYFIDYTAADESNPDWTGNNSSKWWESAFSTTTANWSSGELCVGYDTTLAWPWMNTTIDDKNGVYGVFIRVPFTGYDKSSYTGMELQVDYDDAVTVWLNGTEIHKSANAPTVGADDTWDKTASSAHTADGDGDKNPDYTNGTYDVTSYMSSLDEGSNFLAIGNWSDATVSDDLAAGIKLYLTKEISTTTVSGYTSGTPSVPPTTVDKPSTGNCLGTFKFDGVGTVSEITLTEYGTCDAPNDLENVKLFQDDGDGNWESGDDTTQLGSTTTFSGASSTATFSGLSLTAGTSCYVHVVLDVKSSANTADTIGIKISNSSDIESTASLVEADSWPVQLGTSNIGVVTVVSNYTGGTPTVPPSSVTPPSTDTCLGTFKFDGEGTISQITLTEYGTCDADSHLENVKLFEDDGDGNWESGDDTTQLGSTTTFSGASSTATFSGLNLTAGSTCYVHVVLDVKSTANNGDTIGIELYQGDIVCTSTTTASSWPVQLGTSIITVPSAWWTAYNDCGDDYEGQDNYDWASTGNVTNIGGENSPSSGELIKYSNGTGTGVTLALSGTLLEGYGAEHGHPTEPATITRTPPVAAPVGTAAYDEFGTIVNQAGITYADTGNTLTLTLSGLSNSKTYTLVVLGARGRYSEANDPSLTNRWCSYTISDVTSFINSSSSGAEISTTIVTDDTVTYLAGDNYNENNGTKGDYAKWTSIVSGDDGDVVVTISGVVHGADPANKAYLSAIKLIQEEANIIVGKYTSGSPTVPPEEVVKGTTENCLGTFKFNGSGTVSQITLTEYGTCDADSVLENVKLFQDDGDGSWASGDDTTQLGSTTTFNASNKATFSSLSLPAGSTCYAHIVLGVLSGATTGQTIGIELYQDDIICTSTTTAASWPVKLGTSTIVLPDTIAPSAVTNLSGLTGDYYAGQIDLNWTAPGDDGTSGDNKPTAYYTLKYATYSVSALGGDTTAWWNSAFTYSQSWDVSNQGETEDKTLLGFTPGATYWFAIKTTDDKDNTSFIDTLAGSSQVWVVAYQVQAGTNKYDYSESTGITRWAWKYLLGNNVVFDVNTKEQAYVTKTDFTETMYATIEAPEETSYESFSDKFPVKYTYTFQISEYEDYVSSLHGWIKVQSELDDTSNYNLYIWNETNTQWEQLDTSNVNDAWEVLDGTISATCSNYIDSENKVSLAFYKEDPGNQAKYIWTDYVFLEVSVSPPTDTEVPNAITNLSALTGDNPGKIELNWTAPGDDGSSGNNGAGAYYTVRYGTFPVVGTSSTTWWNHGSVLTYSQSWSVGAQGSGEDFIVDGLDPGVTYYFQVRTTDESNNQSAIDINGGSGSTQANAVAASAGDITEPEAITTLSGLTWTSQGEIKLTWTSPGDDGWNNDFDSGSEFDIRYSTVDSQSPAISTTTFANCSLVSEFSPIPEPVTALWPYNMIVTGLTPGVTYYFAMKTRDEVPNWSGLSNGATAWAQVDDIAPEAVTTLSGLTWTYEGEIKLSWTSPGDDGWNNDFDSGSEFDIRYSTVASQSPAKSTTTFEACSSVSEFSSIPTPVTALVEYSMTITGLTPGVTYYFAMKTADEVPNWSGLSNGATTWAQVDDIAPEAITTLSGLTWTAEGEIKLTWTAPGDDGWNNDFDSGSEFDIRYSTITNQSPSKSTTTFEACSSVSEFSSIPTPVTALVEYSMTVTGLTPGATYYFAIRTADNQSNWSDLSNGATTWAQVDVTAPEAITTLSGLTWTTEGEIKLTWTSPGDDGWNNDFDSGSEFDIRYSTVDSQSPAISTTTFEACSLVSEFSPIPTPVTALWPYSMTITGLTPGVTYYFAMKTSDEIPNWSGLSNGATTWAQVDDIAPEAITTLSGLTWTAEGEIKLTWTAPGDDGWNNDFDSGSEFDIRYSTIATQSPSKSTTTFEACLSVSEFSPIPTPVTALWPYSMSITGLASGVTYYFAIRTADDQSNLSDLSNGATTWAQVDVTAPAGITDLTGLCDSDTGDVTLSWSTPGDDGWNNTLAAGSKYIIDYATYTVQWSTENYKVSISTSGVAPHTEVSYAITGLTGDTTWYFQIWTRDEIPANWSGLSNGATVWVNPILSVTIEPSIRAFGEVPANQSDVLTDGFTVENAGNITQKYQLRLTGVPTGWTAKSVAGAPEWEQVKILGLFTTQSPLETTHFSDNPPSENDGDIVRTGDDDQATSTNFAIPGEGVEVKGYNVTVGAIRYLWFRFDAPSGTSITNEQFLTVTVTAVQQ